MVRRTRQGLLALGFGASLAAAASGVVGCSDARLSGTDGGTNPGAVDAFVRFDREGVVELTPSQVVSFDVLAPAGSLVNFGLEGAYEDSSLRESSSVADGGRATLTLRAPTKRTTFVLRASVAGAIPARIQVSVSDSGFATVTVRVGYAGARTVGPVVVGAVVGRKCSTLADGSGGDGSPVASGLLGMPLTLGSIPAGGAVAVVARSNGSLRGCADVDALVANATRDVSVALENVPLRLGSVDYDVTFPAEPSDDDLASWRVFTRIARTKFVDVAFPDDGDEASVLLDAMSELVAAGGKDEFDARRTSARWDGTVRTYLGTKRPSLRDRASEFLLAGDASTLGTLSGSLTMAKANAALFAPTTFGALDAKAAGFVVRAPFQWSADSNDVVHLEGEIQVFPTALVGAAADVPLEATSGNVPAALAAAIDCAGLAAALGGGSAPTSSCDVTCATMLCKGALAKRWSKASGSSALSNDTLILATAASGTAAVADDATPGDWSGTFVARVRYQTKTWELRGRAKGTRR
ncbi:MAG: hypothetical protein U0169_07690 [Polyangiaceae bacterium]